MSLSNSTISYASSQSISPLQLDVYDKFIDIYFNCHTKVQVILIKTISEYVRHPVYIHLLKTMDIKNADYIIGYLRSQRSIELYNILDRIICNPLPEKDTFYNTTK